MQESQVSLEEVDRIVSCYKLEGKGLHTCYALYVKGDFDRGKLCPELRSTKDVAEIS